MKSVFTFILLLTSYLSVSQVKIPKEYTVQVTYKSGTTEVIPVRNTDKKIDIPKPIVAEGSIFYDGEYLLLNVKSIKILKTSYFPDSKTSSDVRVDKVKIYDQRLGKEKTVNVIHDPTWEASQRKAESEAKSIFAPSDEKLNQVVKNEKDTLKKQPDSRVIRDTIVKSKVQNVYEADGNGNFKIILNSGLKLVGNRVINQTDGEWMARNIDANSKEYAELSKLKLKKGCYIIEKELNQDNIVLAYRVIPVKFNVD